MKRVPVERRCISRDAPYLQLFCHALILLSSAGNYCPCGSCLGSFLKDLWVQAVLCTSGVPEGSQPLAPQGGRYWKAAWDQTSSCSCHLQPLSFRWQQLWKMKSTIFTFENLSNQTDLRSDRALPPPASRQAPYHCQCCLAAGTELHSLRRKDLLLLSCSCLHPSPRLKHAVSWVILKQAFPLFELRVMNSVPLKKYGLCYGKVRMMWSLHEILVAVTYRKRMSALHCPHEWSHRKEVWQGRGWSAGKFPGFLMLHWLNLHPHPAFPLTENVPPKGLLWNWKPRLC